MYPPELDSTSQYLLQNTAQVEQLLQDLPHIELVVDMAHLNIWKKETIPEKLQLLELVCDSEVLPPTADRLLEIHISDNDSYRDSHSAITERTWWVPYAAMFPPNVPLVLESRMNRQSVEQVRQQIEVTQSLLSVRASG
jgi:hypothetical protein